MTPLMTLLLGTRPDRRELAGAHKLMRLSTRRAHAGSLTNLMKGGALMPTLTAIAQGAYSYQALKSMAQDIVQAAQAAVPWGKDLPPLENELALFIEQSKAGPTADRNKAILARILDMNRRYYKLNETPAQAAFNRITHIVALNSMRAPTKAQEYLAQAELDLARLWRAQYSGDPLEQDDWAITRAAKKVWSAIAGEPTDDQRAAAAADDLAHERAVIEPYSITETYAREMSRPTALLRQVAFPADPRFLPAYEKVVLDVPPMQYLPGRSGTRLARRQRRGRRWATKRLGSKV